MTAHKDRTVKMDLATKMKLSDWCAETLPELHQEARISCCLNMKSCQDPVHFAASTDSWRCDDCGTTSGKHLGHRYDHADCMRQRIFMTARRAPCCLAVSAPWARRQSRLERRALSLSLNGSIKKPRMVATCQALCANALHRADGNIKQRKTTCPRSHVVHRRLRGAQHEVARTHARTGPRRGKLGWQWRCAPLSSSAATWCQAHASGKAPPTSPSHQIFLGCFFRRLSGQMAARNSSIVPAAEVRTSTDACTSKGIREERRHKPQQYP